MELDHRHGRHMPRSWTSLFLPLGGWWLLVMAAIFVVITFFAQSAINDSFSFETRGITTDAEVLELWTETRRDTDGGQRTGYFIRYSFAGPDAQNVVRVEAVDRGIYSPLSVGDVIALRYIVQPSLRVEFPIGENRATGRILFAVNWAILLVLSGLLWWIGGKTNRGIKARRDGDRTIVTVTGKRRTKIRVNGAYRYRLVWQDTDGLTGKSLMGPRNRFSNYQPGDQTIVYRHQKDTWWQGDVGPRA